MKTIQIDLYDFNELSDNGKEAARKWWRDASQGDDWYEGVYEDFRMICDNLGIKLKRRDKNGGYRIFFSGFSSQGDGACFEGSWQANNLVVGGVKGHAPVDEELHRIAGIFEETAKEFPTSSFTTTHRSRYYHENSVDFAVCFHDNPDVCYNADELLALDAKELVLKQAAKDLMKWLYKQLEEADDYCNSDEQIDEAILAGEYTFTADGEHFEE